MIKLEVTIDECAIIFGDYKIFDSGDLDPLYRAFHKDDLIGEFCTIEKAIKYCMEHSKWTTKPTPF